MKLYLSSYRIPTPSDLAALLGKELSQASVALIPNAKDYYSKRPWEFKVGSMVEHLQEFGLSVETIDLREYRDENTLKQKLSEHDLIWAMGGNTYMLRYEMQQSGFENIIEDLLGKGIVYGGDSAGALVAGQSIAGVELADEPEFAEELLLDGLKLVPFVILPHVDNPEFADVLPVFRERHSDAHIIELADSEAVVFDGLNHKIIAADTDSPPIASEVE